MCREVKPGNSENTLLNGEEKDARLSNTVELMKDVSVSSYSPRAWLPSLLIIILRVVREAGGLV